MPKPGFSFIGLVLCMPVPLTSNRHHLSYDDCLENKGDYRTARAVLEAIIAFSAMRT